MSAFHSVLLLFLLFPLEKRKGSLVIPTGIMHDKFNSKRYIYKENVWHQTCGETWKVSIMLAETVTKQLMKNSLLISKTKVTKADVEWAKYGMIVKWGKRIILILIYRESRIKRRELSFQLSADGLNNVLLSSNSSPSERPLWP